VQAEEILIGYFVECQSIKKVGGRRSVEGSIFRFARRA